MTTTPQSAWHVDFAQSTPLFSPLQAIAKNLITLVNWPTLEDFNTAFEQQGLSIKAVPQGGKPSNLEDHYEPRIFLRGELQTRLKNWHDLMNALVWLRFPATKAALNAQHYHAAKQREAKTNRSPLENKLARFDECGAVIIYRYQETLQQIRDHQWQTLFLDQRDRFDNDIRCLVFGHAMYEKALNPYLGMTTNTLLIHEAGLLNASYAEIDATLAAYWQGVKSVEDIELLPFPILGVPGWHADNIRPEFYQNQQYFRPL